MSGRKTVDDLKRQRDGTTRYDPARHRQMHEPDAPDEAPGNTTWAVDCEVQATAHFTVEVEAASEEEALEKAGEMAPPTHYDEVVAEFGPEPQIARVAE